MATFSIFRKSQKEGGDGFARVCLPFEKRLAVVIQRVPGSNE